MIDISDRLRHKREELGLTVDEAAADLKVNPQTLENLEKANIQYFNNDIYNLKNLIKEYAKYLSLDHEKIIDEFNEYIFDFTSKIPVKEIKEKVSLDDKNKVKSPYTMEDKSLNIIFKVIIILFLLVVTIIIILLFLFSFNKKEGENKVNVEDVYDIT